MEKRNQLGGTSQPSQQNQAAQQSPSLGASSKKGQNIPPSDGPAVRSRNSAAGMKKSGSSNSQGGINGSGTFNENDTFNKHYNKELRVSKDEIPIVLAELNDSSIQFIKREQYEKALNLLQKAYGIMDVVDFNLCRRDKFHLFILFHNMALCYQKMQMLDECAQCIEQALEYILPNDQFNLQEKSISNRMRKLQILGKLKMQYCAILSQVHRHKDALEQAREGVKISHQLINDMKQLCEFYSRREEIENSIMVNNGANNSISGGFSRNGTKQDLNYNSYYSQKQDKKAHSSRNRSFSQFLSQQESIMVPYLGGDDMKSIGGFQQPQNMHKRQESMNSQNHNLSSFYSLNYLEESMSFIERTARKLIPILRELKKKMIPEKSLRGKSDNTIESYRVGTAGGDDINNSDNDLDYNESVSKRQQLDMKNILGYLNQGEWTQTLSIGSIMQLQPFTLKDLLEQGKNELELTRDSFIAKVSFLAVSYFCYSTEIRFILQMKEDPTYDPVVKQRESEYWHAKSLEIACTFLPGECPLLNHINLSYQKHFAPVKTTILEDEANNDDLIVVKPLNGIDNPKFQPIIRQVQNIQIAITPYQQLTPINNVANQFLSQVISFNDYQEQQNQIINQQQKSSFTKSGGKIASSQQQHQKSKSNDVSTKQKANKQKSKSTYDDLLDDDLSNPHNKPAVQQNISQFDNNNNSSEDLKRFEELFDKLVKENRIDKNELMRRLQIQSQNTVVLEEGDSSQFNDLLLDEQILAEESIEAEDQQIALEAKHQNSNPSSSNLYKFRNKDSRTNSSGHQLAGDHRPKTSHSIHRQNNNSIGDNLVSEQEKVKIFMQLYQSHQLDENSKKHRQSRPLSGGLQKIKNENHRSRINKMNQNFSMYEKYAPNAAVGATGFSPDKYQSMNNKGSANQFASYQLQSQAGAANQSYQTSQPKNQNQNKSFDAHQQKLNYLQSQQQVSSKIVSQPGQIGINPAQILDKKGNSQIQPPNNIQAYDELKRRLLNEYKKLTSNKKTFDDQVRERYKNLKQRAVSGKKSSSSHQMNSSITTQQQPSTAGQYSQATGNPASQLSPKHHLNVYKPTFIINNSFGESGSQQPQMSIANQNKEADVVEQISKKYRPSSKQQNNNPISQNQQQQLIGNISSGRQNNVGQLFQDQRQQNSSYQNQQPINNSQQLMGLLMNNNPGVQDKKSGGSKKNLKQHNHSQGQQDLSFVKQFLTDKTNSTLTGAAAKQQQPSFITSATGQNFSSSIGGSNSAGIASNMAQYQFQTQTQFNHQAKTMMAGIDAQVSKKAGGSSQQQSAQASGNGNNHKSKTITQQQQISSNSNNGGGNNNQQKLAAYEKLKKKLNYQHTNPSGNQQSK